ncbi:MAG TPA: hypothetical protein VGO00_28495, partial [Kofleriaceae bacterium]|nr:hypothetical protein [Kofleriaceae bacterium]
MRALGLLIVVGCGAAPHPYTLRQFLDVHRSNTASLSPDGSRIAFETNATGDWQVWLTTAKGDAPRQLTHFPSSVGGVLWSPTGDDLLVSSDHDGDQQYQLYLIGAGGSAPRPLTAEPDVKHDIGGWSRDGRSVFFASNARDRRYFDCYLMDVATKQARRVLERDAVMHADAISADGRWLAAIERTSEVDQNVYIADTTTGAARSITPHDGVARFHIVGFAADASALYVVSDAGREFLNLASIDLATGALHYLEDTPHDADFTALSRDGHQLA